MSILWLALFVSCSTTGLGASVYVPNFSNKVCIIIRASPRDNLSRGCMALESLAYLNSDAHFTFVYPISLAPEEARRRYIDTIQRCPSLRDRTHIFLPAHVRKKFRQRDPHHHHASDTESDSDDGPSSDISSAMPTDGMGSIHGGVNGGLGMGRGLRARGGGSGGGAPQRRLRGFFARLLGLEKEGPWAPEGAGPSHDLESVTDFLLKKQGDKGCGYLLYTGFNAVYHRDLFWSLRTDLEDTFEYISFQGVNYKNDYPSYLVHDAPAAGGSKKPPKHPLTLESTLVSQRCLIRLPRPFFPIGSKDPRGQQLHPVKAFLANITKECPKGRILPDRLGYVDRPISFHAGQLLRDPLFPTDKAYLDMVNKTRLCVLIGSRPSTRLAQQCVLMSSLMLQFPEAMSQFFVVHTPPEAAAEYFRLLAAECPAIAKRPRKMNLILPKGEDVYPTAYQDLGYQALNAALRFILDLNVTQPPPPRLDSSDTRAPPAPTQQPRCTHYLVTEGENTYSINLGRAIAPLVANKKAGMVGFRFLTKDHLPKGTSHEDEPKDFDTGSAIVRHQCLRSGLPGLFREHATCGWRCAGGQLWHELAESKRPECRLYMEPSGSPFFFHHTQ